jgi:hypothetical protein
MQRYKREEIDAARSFGLRLSAGSCYYKHRLNANGGALIT